MTETINAATENATISIGDTDTPKPAPKSSTITLTANGATMQIVAELKADGSARTYLMQTDANKKSTRGMSDTHRSMDAAKAATEKMAKAAEKLGWQRKQKRPGFVARPDAFTAIPAPPPAPKATPAPPPAAPKTKK